MAGAPARRVTLPVFLVEDGLVTDAQVRRLREKRMAGKTLPAAAAAAGMSERTARKWQSGALPSTAKVPRTWRTREDPFADVWQSEVVPQLGADTDGRLQRTYSTRFNDFALEFYSFVADNYAPFYSRPIECTDRDAPFVLDGVLYHESDLDLEEHYTDTHGYTEINFAAFVMVGMRFCPRIRSLHRQRIYCADPDRDHGVLKPVLQRGRRAVNFRLIAEQWDRIGQFYAAFPAGHATASAALQRLNRFQASNRFYAANRELGRALKTEFVLQYMSEPQLRAKVRRGLLKVEQLHALARAVYYGQRGRISAREVYDQVNACSCLTLILACIVYWQAREISRLAAAPDFPFDPRPAASCQPDRVEERHPLRRDQDRPRQAQDATPLACISTRMLSVPSEG